VSEEVVAGTMLPSNLAVVCSFSYATLDAAVRRLFGTSLELQEGEAPGAGLTIAPDYELPEDEDTFRALTAFLTYAHEGFHVRHLTASPFGYLLYLLGGSRAWGVRSWLDRWSRDPGEIELPILERHASDEEIQEIVTVEDLHAMYQAIVREPCRGVTLGDMADFLGGMLGEAVRLCERVYGLKLDLPGVSMYNARDELVAPYVSGQAVVEGFARCCEYLQTLQMGASLRMLNRYSVLKYHGLYGQTISITEQIMGLKPPEVWLVVAKISDWALQAPILPLLLDERDPPHVHELLPAWRYPILLMRCVNHKVTVRDLLDREREVGEEFFDELGWEDPWRLAERITTAAWRTPTSYLTRHFDENLRLGARLRLEGDPSLWTPGFTAQTYRLGPLLTVFTDGLLPGTTGKAGSDQDFWSVPAVMVHDAVMEGVLYEQDLQAPFSLASRVTKEEGLQAARQLVARSLDQLLGRSCGEQLSRWLDSRAARTAAAKTTPAFRLGHNRFDRPLVTIAAVHAANGEWEEAARCWKHAVEAAEDRGDPGIAGQAMLDLGNAYQELGRLDAAEEQYRTALERAHEHGDQVSVAMALTNLGNVLAKRGALDAALEHQEEAVTLLRASGDARREAEASLNLGATYIELGRNDEAIRILQVAIAASAALGDPIAGRSRWLLGAAEYGAGRVASAAAAWREALRFLPEDDEQAMLTRRMLAELGEHA